MMVHKGFYTGFDRLRARNRAVWRESWRGRVVIDGSDDGIALDQATLDAAVFYLLSSAHPMSSQGLGICGLSCNDYSNMQACESDALSRPHVRTACCDSVVVERGGLGFSFAFTAHPT